MNGEQFKAVVRRTGAMDENFYGKKQATLTARAVKQLNIKLWTTKPIEVQVFRRTGVVSGNQSRWELVDTIKAPPDPEKGIEQ